MHNRIIVALIAAFFISPAISLAVPAISCHCFQNREFDPRRPDAADEYLLATTFNSFQALALGIEKGSIVRAKMSGQSAEELWLRHWVARETGQSIEEALQHYQSAGSWLAAASRSGLTDPHGRSLPGDLTGDRQLAEVVARSEMGRIFGEKPEKLKELERKGASLKEMTLSLLISTISGDSAEEIFDRARAEGMSWGLVAQQTGLAFSTVETKLKSLSAKQRP